MTDEEKKAIERIEDVFYQDLGKGINKIQKITLYEDSITDIRTVLNLIEKQSKEIEELKDKNKELNKYIEDRAKIGKNIQTFINKDYVEQEYISKEKIREILEYYEWTPADDTDSTIAFYSDIKKLLKGEIREEDVDEFILK